MEALAREIERRYAILKPERTDDHSSTAVTLRDARGAQLFFEDRVCDVLENRARVLARAGEGEGLGSGSGARGKSSRPAPKRKRAVSAPYARDDAAFEYVTPSSSDLLANKPPFSSANAFACPVCVAPARAFAQPQQLQFHIRSHNTAKMTAAQRAKVHAAIQRMDDRRIDGAERWAAPAGERGRARETTPNERRRKRRFVFSVPTRSASTTRRWRPARTHSRASSCVDSTTCGGTPRRGRTCARSAGGRTR